MQTVKLKEIKPADYNPRKLSTNAFENLKNSIKALGVIKPIIIKKENNTILAGHQRTRAMLSLGMEESICFFIEKMNLADEMRFNQFHNSCEYEVNELSPKIKITAKLTPGFNIIEPKNINVLNVGSLASINALRCKMLIKYGIFGSSICDEDGNCGISSAYAYASKLTNTNLLVYCLPKEKYEVALYYFSLNYGVFSYDNIEKKSYIQTKAQMYRLRGEKGFRSTLYEKKIIPYLALNDKEKKLRILDFGAGQKDYFYKLKNMGYNIHAVDPYHRQGRNIIKYRENTKDFLKICADLKKYGMYDIVICDSVLNSVDSKKAEISVIRSLSGLTKHNGMIFFSGRPLSSAKSRQHCGKVKDADVSFLDENNFTGVFFEKNWFFQKFHDKKEIESLAELLSDNYSISGTFHSFHVAAKKTKEIKKELVIDGLRFEWNMPLPGGKSYNLSNEIENAYEYAIEKKY